MTDETDEGRTVEFKHPVNDIRELEYERHIALEFRKKNLNKTSLGDKTKTVEAPNLVENFANYVLDKVDHGLDAENLSYDLFDHYDIDQKFVNVLVMREAHNIPFSQLQEYLENNPDIAQQVGYNPDESIHSGNYINQKALNLEKRPVPGSQEETYRDLLGNVATRIVWGAVRSGIVLPVRTTKKYDIKLSYDEALSQVTRKNERAALHNTVRYLLDQTSSPFEFFRASNKSHEYERYIGIFAMAAYGDDGLSGAWKNLPSSVDLDAPTNILANIQKSPDPSSEFEDGTPVDAQFNEVFLNMFELVDELGIIDDNVSVAQDPTLVTSELEDSPTTIGSGNTQVWYFPITSGVDTYFRLALNLDLFNSKEKTHDKFEDRLTKVARYVGVENLYLDGEYDSAPVIDACKDIVSEHWLIGTGHNPDRNGYPSDEELPAKDDSPRWYDVTVGEHDVNLVALYRYEEEPQLEMYLTNIEKNSKTRNEILDLFNRRRAIEETIREVKEFMPDLENANRDLQYYTMGMATYLYNIYVMTKIVYTPKYQLPLNPTKKQVLTAVIEVCSGDYPEYYDGV